MAEPTPNLCSTCQHKKLVIKKVPTEDEREYGPAEIVFVSCSELAPVGFKLQDRVYKSVSVEGEITDVVTDVYSCASYLSVE